MTNISAADARFLQQQDTFTSRWTANMSVTVTHGPHAAGAAGALVLLTQPALHLD